MDAIVDRLVDMQIHEVDVVVVGLGPGGEDAAGSLLDQQEEVGPGPAAARRAGDRGQGGRAAGTHAGADVQDSGEVGQIAAPERELAGSAGSPAARASPSSASSRSWVSA